MMKLQDLGATLAGTGKVRHGRKRREKEEEKSETKIKRFERKINGEKWRDCKDFEVKEKM